MSPEYAQILDELESEWNRSRDVNLEEFLRPRIRDLHSADPASASVIALVAEAVQIDMERRAGAGSLVTAWTLEDYLKSFPILASPGILESLKLFASKLPAKSERTFQESAKPGKSARANGDNDELGNGDQFGPYQVVREIGRGGMGTVYEAFHVHLGKRVALKLISRTVLHDQTAKTRFRREMKAVGMVDHNNVVRAMDAGEVEGSLYLVTEYIAGIDLGKLIREKGPLQSSEALLIVRQSANALQAAHTAGIVHRDVKPSNLLLTETGEVKLLDLGLARVANDVTGDATNTGSIFGTPDYMAPEQWDDVRNVDARADLYSLGCTLFYLLTGQAPFSGEKHRSPSSKMRAHLDAAAPPLPQSCDDPEGLVFAMVSKMMAKKPENRYSSAAQVVQAIDNLLGPQQGNVAALRVNVPDGKRRASGVRGPELTPPVINRPSRSVLNSGNSRHWLISTISVLALGGVAILWWLNFGGNSEPTGVSVSDSREATKAKSSDEVTDQVDSGAATDSPASNAPLSSAEAVPVTPTNASKELPVVVGNAHRRLAEMALRFGRPVEVQFAGNDGSQLLNRLEDLPNQDLVLRGNWNFFADCPDWKDEHIDLLRGIHSWADLNLNGTQVSPFGMSKLGTQNLEVFNLSVSKKQLIGLGGILNAIAIGITTTTDEQSSHWPEFMGNQPQLRTVYAGYPNDHLLSLLVRNKRLIRLELAGSGADPITPHGLKLLAELPCLSELSLNNQVNGDELLLAVREVKNIRRLSSPYQSYSQEAIKALKEARPDIVIYSPHMDWNEAEYVSVQTLTQKGVKIYSLPPQINESEKVPFIVGGISWPGALLEEFDPATAPIQGITFFHCTDMNQGDIDQIFQGLSTAEALNEIILSGTASRITGLTFLKLSKLRSLYTLNLHLHNEIKTLSGEDLMPLRNCQALTHLVLLAFPGIDDQGLRALSECSSINSLSIVLHQEATAEGLAALRQLPDLRVLHLACGNFDDAKLLTLARIQTLRTLYLQGCVGEGLTVDGIQKVHEALPKCVIFHGDQIVFPDDSQ